MPIEHVGVSERARDQLVKLKRNTGIPHWNELCRWALCLSLAEPSIPAAAKIVTDSSVDMTWRQFGGTFSDVYLALLRERCHRDGLELSDDNLAAQFKLHLHRGIGYLAADRRLTNLPALFRRLELSSEDRLS